MLLEFKDNRFTLSAFRSDATLTTNWNNHKELENGLRNLGLKPLTVVGYYKEEGQQASEELSLQVVDLNHEQIDTVYKLAKKFNQDSLLVEDSAGVYVVYTKEPLICFTDMGQIGTKLVEVDTMQELVHSGGGTISGNKYYVADTWNIK